MSGRPEDSVARSPEFVAPATATPLTARRAWWFYGLVAATAIAAAHFRDSATWPADYPWLTVVALALAIAVANMFGTFQTIEGLAEYTSLAMPIGFAMFLLLDWQRFVVGVVLGELLTFVSEYARGVNPTMWYVRLFNVFAQVVSGAGALIVLRTFPLPYDIGTFGAGDIRIAAIVLLASVAFKALDSGQTQMLLTLAARLPISNIRISLRVFFAQFALFITAVPLARLWSENMWLSIFTLTPLAVAYRLLRLPELEHRSRTDERTGLTNAVEFDRTLEIALDAARERDRPAALLAIDLDYFKAVNDTYGHLAGDAVLTRFAEILAGLRRNLDVAARTGGEEFALYLDGADRTAALAFAERLRALIERETFHYDGDVTIAITVSVGVAVFPGEARSPRELRKIADDALYLAKRSGRNRIGALPAPAAAPSS